MFTFKHTHTNNQSNAHVQAVPQTVTSNRKAGPDSQDSVFCVRLKQKQLFVGGSCFLTPFVPDEHLDTFGVETSSL